MKITKRRPRWAVYGLKRFYYYFAASLAQSALLLAAGTDSESIVISRPCPQIIICGSEKIDFSAAQRKIICGDNDSEGWRSIPFNQAQRFLRSALQQYGYNDPRFEISSSGSKLTVDLGKKAHVTGIQAKGIPKSLKISKKRKIVGEVLTPSILDQLQGWIKTRLQTFGYACPEIKLNADSVSGTIFANVQTGKIYRLENIEVPEPSPLINPLVFKRYEAFEFGKPVNLQLLTLTSNRILEKGFLLSTYYDLSCDSKGDLHIIQRFTPAKPRQITIGFGVDTEGIIRGRAKWQHSRIGKKINSAEFSTMASFKEQSAETLLHYYFLDTASRLNLVPRLFFQHQNEDNYEALSGLFSLMPTTTWDNQYLHVDLRAGPAYEYAHTLEGDGPQNSLYLTLNTGLDVTSHLFEYYLGEPQNGWQASLETSSRIENVLSNISAHRLQARAEALWNLGNFDPPIIVLGWRGLIGSTWVSGEHNQLPPKELPQTMRFYLGGDADIRGFSRKDLPSDQVGFLSALYQGIELRLGDVFPYKIQPLIFFDAAMGSREFMNWDSDVYTSPGFGTRWNSPFGVFRFTLARGFLWMRDQTHYDRPAHWQFFFSFGQEF